MKHVQRAVRVCALGAVFAATALVAGCGDDSEDPEKVAIEAAGSGKAVTFTAPAEAEAGAAEIEFTNNSDEETDAQLVFVDGDYTEEEVIAELGKAIQGSQPVAEWFQGAGGPGSTAPGETSTVEQELKAGTYYVVGQDEPTPPLTKIEVSGDDGAEVEEPDAKVTAQEYSFSAEGLKSGEQKVLLDNAGGTWHHFLAAQLKPDATIEQAKQFLQSEGEGGGPPPFVGNLDEGTPVSSTVLDAGTSQVVDLNLEPGKYAFFCFISDKTGGPPHVVKGMVSEVNVEE